MTTAVLDANVLYPAALRDLFMHLALLDLYRARWTDAIHGEWTRNVLKNRPDLTQRQLERTKNLMNAHVRGCLVTNYEALIPTLNLPDSGDRHVLAAAIKAEASVIVTFNLSDFPASLLASHNIRAQHPDLFITNLIRRNSEGVCLAVRRQRENLQSPPLSPEQLLAVLRNQGLETSVGALESYVDIL